jgi:hypothetical protein
MAQSANHTPILRVPRKILFRSFRLTGLSSHAFSIYPVALSFEISHSKIRLYFAPAILFLKYILPQTHENILLPITIIVLVPDTSFIAQNPTDFDRGGKLLAKILVLADHEHIGIVLVRDILQALDRFDIH